MKKFIKYLLVGLVVCLTPCLFIGCKKENNKFSVEIPESFEGCGYEIVLPSGYQDGDLIYLKGDDNFSFTILIDEMYDISQVVVKLNDVEINTVKDYTNNSIIINSSNFTQNAKYTVHNLVKKEFVTNFKLVKYSNGNLEATTSTMGLEDVSVKIGNKTYTLKQLVENNISVFGYYGDEISFMAKSNEEDKYLNLEKLFITGSNLFSYSEETKEYLPSGSVKYLLKGFTTDEEGWLPYSIQLKNNETIYINNECLTINQKYLIQESGLDIPSEITSVYGVKTNILDSLINPNNISRSLIKTEFYINSNWTQEQPVNAGSYKSRIIFEGNDAYYPFSKEFDYNITKRTIVYDVNNIEITYGEKPTISISENKILSMGFVNGSDVNTITIKYNILDVNNAIISDTSNLNVNKYKISLSATSINYDITFANDGELIVNPAELPDNILTVDNINKIYDKQNTNLSVQVLEEFKQKLTIIYRPYEIIAGQKQYLDETTEVPVFNDVYSGGVDIQLSNSNYVTKTVTALVTISKAEIEADAIKVYNIETIYDGKDHTFTIETSKELDLEDFVITYNGNLEIPSIKNANEDEVTLYDIVFASKNYEDFIIENKYIKISKATPVINKKPTHQKVFVGDELSTLLLNSDFEIIGVNDDNLNGEFIVLNNHEILNSEEYVTNNIKFVPTNTNYNSVTLIDYIINVTQLTVNVPKGIIVKNLDTNENLITGLNYIKNNTRLLITIEEIEGYTFSNLKGNDQLLNYNSESGGYDFVITGENLLLTIDFVIDDLQLSSLNNLIDIPYNYGNIMGEVELSVLHAIADTFTYSWYKLKDKTEDIISEPITEKLLNEHYERINNSTNKLSIYSCDESGFYVVKVEAEFNDIKDNVVNLVSYSNLIKVSTKQIRCYISEPPKYLAKVGDLIKNIEFNGGKIVTEDGVEVSGEIRTFNVLDTDTVVESGTEVCFEAVLNDEVNYYFDQSEDDGKQTYSMLIIKNCYTYTFIFKDGTREYINIVDGQTITLPVVTTGSGSWKIQEIGIFITSGIDVVVGVDKNIDLKDITFVAA